MPRELVCLQVGQCGNQIGCKFWDLALQEHLKHHSDGTLRKQHGKTAAPLEVDEAMSSFFYTSSQGQVKARAVPVDMEEGVLDGLLKGNLATLFDRRHFIANSSGSGNNWAVGHELYGQECLPDVMEKVRVLTEDCDSLQTFLLLHSLGGGTGSGFGSRILEELQDEYPSIYRFVSAVFPQHNDDVVTSPYNAMLSLSKLIDHADCVLPVDNSQLAEIASASKKSVGKDAQSVYSIGNPNVVKSHASQEKKGGEAYDTMNYIVGSMLTHLTASMRFPGQLNVDLNEITTNLVPFPKLHFLHSAVAPLSVSKMGSQGSQRVNELFRESFDRRNQLLTAPQFRPTYFASCALLRGDVCLSDAISNIEKLQSNLKLADWNREGFKMGLCSVPAVEAPASLLSLTNNSGIVEPFNQLESRFVQLYNVGAHLHHYTEYLEKEEIDAALDNVRSLIDTYNTVGDMHLPEEARELGSMDRLLF